VSADPHTRLVAAARAQAKQMHVRVVLDEPDTDGSHVLGLERLHPAVRNASAAQRKNLDVARGTLRIDGRGPQIVIALDADWRVREFSCSRRARCAASAARRCSTAATPAWRRAGT
jgi:hypothetical protein